MTKKQDLNKIIEDAEALVGFGAVQKYGRVLKPGEVKKIAAYAVAFGGNRDYVTYILKNAGRPFSVEDPTFRKRCLICKSLNNYCCC